MYTLPLLPLGSSSAQALLQRKFSPNAPLPLAQEDLAHIYDKAQGLPGALILLAGDYVMTVDETRTPNSKKTPAKPAAKAQKFPLTHVLALAFVALALLFSYLYNPSKSEDTAANNELPTEPMDVLNSIPLPENNAQAPAQTQAESIPVPAPDYNYSQTEPAPINTEPAPSLELSEEPVAIAPVPRPQPAVKAAPEPKAASAQNTASSDKQKLKTVQSGFVVQVFASYELASAKSFIKQYSSIKPALYWYETRHNNKPWYVVVAGVYKDRQSAQQAVERWPAALRKQSPWIRDIKAVQEALR
jgi:DamX protein